MLSDETITNRDKRILVVLPDDKVTMTRPEFDTYEEEINSAREFRLVRVAEQPGLDIYRRYTYGEWIRSNDGSRKVPRQIQKIFYVSVNISKHDFDVKIRKIQDNLSKGRTVKIAILVKKKDREHAHKNLPLINEWLETVFGSNLVKVKDREFRVKG